MYKISEKFHNWICQGLDLARVKFSKTNYNLLLVAIKFILVSCRRMLQYMIYTPWNITFTSPEKIWFGKNEIKCLTRERSFLKICFARWRLMCCKELILLIYSYCKYLISMFMYCFFLEFLCLNLLIVLLYWLKIPYPLQCNPGVLFFKIDFWVRFYSTLTDMGLYSSWGSIN